MMNRTNTYWLLLLFIVVSVINLISVAANWQLGIYFSKPLLLFSLAAWYYFCTNKNASFFRNLILFGLLWSIAGDTLLMLVHKNDSFFLLGLGCFLLTHVFYISAFVKFPNFTKGKIISNPILSIPIVAYLVCFIWYLLPDLLPDLKIPVIFYGIIISTMLTLSINMIGRESLNAVKMLVPGALFFVISDSIIALGKFKSVGLNENILGLLIMATYIIGQFLIAKSCIQLNSQLSN